MILGLAQDPTWLLVQRGNQRLRTTDPAPQGPWAVRLLPECLRCVGDHVLRPYPSVTRGRVWPGRKGPAGRAWQEGPATALAVTLL